MVGDGPGDRRAAEAAGASFFPIIPGREAESWGRLSDAVLPRLFADEPVAGELKAWNAAFNLALQHE